MCGRFLADCGWVQREKEAMIGYGGPVAFVETAVTAPVTLLKGVADGLLLIFTVIFAFNAVRCWYLYPRNPADYSLGGALIYLIMALMLAALLLVDLFVGF